MMKNKVQIIGILLSILFFNSFYIACALNDSGNAKVEMGLTAKGSPAIQAPYRIVHRFFHDGQAGNPGKFKVLQTIAYKF